MSDRTTIGALIAERDKFREALAEVIACMEAYAELAAERGDDNERLGYEMVAAIAREALEGE